MFNLPVCLVATISCCFVSCSVSDYHAVGVSDAFLDTPVRKSDVPYFAQSSTSDWKTGLPSADYVASLRQQRQLVGQPKAVSAPPASVNAEYREGYYPVRTHRVVRHHIAPHYYGKKKYRKYGGHHHVKRTPHVRTVEKVGPSIVPQPPLPSSTRSYTGGPRILPRRGVAVVPAAPIKPHRRDDHHGKWYQSRKK